MTGEELRALPQNTAVRVLHDSAGNFQPDQVIYRDRRDGDCRASSMFSERPNGSGFHSYMEGEEVELVGEETPPAVATIARPVLEERKIGKISIELFDEGFPNAVMAVGEVMTWAAEHKGYKPHDWKNLPNPDTAFLAAGSRHRVKRHIQRASGVNHAACVDEESHLLHLAHEAFNVLAQLELVTTGRIK